MTVEQTFEERMAAYAQDGDEKPKTFEEFQLMYWEVVTNICNRIARSNATVEADDLIQDLWVDMQTKGRWKKVIDYNASTPGVLKKQAERIAAKERVDYMHFSGSYLYTPKDVRRILEESVWCEVEKAPDLEGRVDVRAQFDKLVPNRQSAIYKRYGLGLESHELTKSEQNALYNGVDQITDKLNVELKYYSVSYDAAFKDEFGASEALAQINRDRRANQASNFLNGKD